MPLSIDTVLDGKFRIVQILGEGGMGTVYKVVQEGPPGTPPDYYAVKELLISLQRPDSGMGSEPLSTIVLFTSEGS